MSDGGIELVVAIVNVLTLRPQEETWASIVYGGMPLLSKVQALEMQFKEAVWHVIGIQEGRES